MVHEDLGFSILTLTFMLNFGRYVLVSKSSDCSAIVHRESGGEIFTFIRKILPNIESSVDDSLPASKEG